MIDGLNELPVKSPEEIMALLEAGEAHRHYGQTNMNERSVSNSVNMFKFINRFNRLFPIPLIKSILVSKID